MLDFRTLRKAAGLSQDELAKKLDVTQSAVSHWESGDWPPLRKYRKKLARILDVTEDELKQVIGQ